MSKKYQYMRVRLASPEEIISWSHGEVRNHETINYRTLKPEDDGLFCEKIFGPTKDNQCKCGKSKKGADRGTICKVCGVEITDKKVRRERFGHIKLASPVVHTWFLKNSPSRLALLLGIQAKQLEDVVYYNSYIVTGEVNPITGYTIKENSTDKKYNKFDIVSETEFTSLCEHNNPSEVNKVIGTGAEAIKKLLHSLDLKKEVQNLRNKLKENSKQDREKTIKRLSVAEAFLESDNNPEWMVLDVIPVIPPDLRPMVILDGGKPATNDLNDLYRVIISRNNRLKELYNQEASHLIIKNEKRLLQGAVDALIDNAKHPSKNTNDRNSNLKSLSEMLRGKQGRFRQNLLGKRVDFSGRSVIAVGPSLKMYQCGLPREMALILFEPYVIKGLLDDNEEMTFKKARDCVKTHDSRVWPILEDVIREHPVLLNRAPTLHRLGIQAFEPILVEGKAIRLHPLVCPAFNADFDGDQMAVHLPLSLEAQAEARLLMLASNNILNPKDGSPVATPSQDMILGNYYLSLERKFYQGHVDTLPKGVEVVDNIDNYDYSTVLSDQRYDQGDMIATGNETDGYDLYRVAEHNEGKFFTSYNEAYLAYKNGVITLHTRIFVDPHNLNEATLTTKRFDGIDIEGKYLFTTMGKLIFNTILSENLPYVNNAKGEKPKDPNKKVDPLDLLDPLKPTTIKNYIFDPKQDKVEDFLARGERKAFGKKLLSAIISEVFKKSQLAETSKMLDRLKDLGFQYSTISGISISIADIDNYSKRLEYINDANKQVDFIKSRYNFGFINEKERYDKVCSVWRKIRDDVEAGLWEEMSERKDNSIFMMADSGSRGSKSNFAQLAGMRGLMADTNGRAIEVPVTSNFYEGLTISEFFISSHGSRKGSTDTALKTAESGYMTRRLVDVAQDVIITIDDCGTTEGFKVSKLIDADDNNKVMATLGSRCEGRYLANDTYDKNGVLIGKRNQIVTEEIKSKLDGDDAPEFVYIRSNLTCKAPSGLCAKCYGLDLATKKPVEIGEAVGVIAAQSIGEPGTQLTMRTFHNGGVASGGDITQGLPRVAELFEARNPKGKATLVEIDGTVKKIETNKSAGRIITITDDKSGEDYEYKVDGVSELLVKEGQKVTRGDRLMKGRIAPKELLRICDEETVEHYIIDEVQKPYLSQGVSISDKHIEIIIRQMLRRVLIVSEGDSKFLPGLQYSARKFKQTINDMFNKGLESGKMPSLPVAKPLLLGITKAASASDSFLSAASFQETTRALTDAIIRGQKDYLLGLKENVIIGGLIPAGTGVLEEDEFISPEPRFEEEEYTVPTLNFGLDSTTDVSFEESLKLDSDESDDIEEEADVEEETEETSSDTI